MEALLILLVLAYMLVLVQNDQGMAARLLSLVGMNRRLTRSEFILILSGLVLLALFVAIEPETRIFLLFLDSVGVDLFVTLCVLFLRHNLLLIAAILLIPILRWTYRWGPVPGFWPSRLVIRSSATWAGYAVVVPAITLCGAAIAALCMAAVLSGVVTFLKLV